MVTIVTGKMNQQKTTTIKSIYQNTGKGDGFISIKKMIDDRVHSYQAMRLSTNEKNILMTHKNFCIESNEKQQKIGPYLINGETLKWVNKNIEKMIDERVSPIYLDEIGVLELQGEGFNNSLVSILKAKLDLVITVRYDLVEKVIAKYKINNPKFSE